MSDCVMASGRVNNGGYVQVYVAALAADYPHGLGAHRLAWIEAHGPIPKGLCVCHRCDNRRCINVEHLFLGTTRDNARDCWAKGRAYKVEKHRKARGSAQGNARLTEGWVRAGRQLRAEGLQYKEIAGELGISTQTVYDFCKRRTWAHV